MTDHNSIDDLTAVYKDLRDKYELILTNAFALDEGFTIDCPIIVGHTHEQIIELYLDDELFVLDVMDEAQTKGMHCHPNNVQNAIELITEFMDGKSDYEMSPFNLSSV